MDNERISLPPIQAILHGQDQIEEQPTGLPNELRFLCRSEPGQRRSEIKSHQIQTQTQTQTQAQAQSQKQKQKQKQNFPNSLSTHFTQQPQQISQQPLYTERAHHVRSHSHSHSHSHSQTQTHLTLPFNSPSNSHSHRRTVSASVSLDTALDTPMWQSPPSSPQHRYHCSQCPKTFTRPSSLRIHVFSHTGEKPHACPHNGCGRRFSVQSNMRRHLRVHYCPSKPESTNILQEPFDIISSHPQSSSSSSSSPLSGPSSLPHLPLLSSSIYNPNLNSNSDSNSNFTTATSW